jgi:Zn-dependent protease/CBS domain-containing protein
MSRTSTPAAEPTVVPAPEARRTGRGRVRLGSVLGFEIDIDHSWFVIFFLVFWSLSQAVFPDRVPEISRSAYVAMGFVGTVLFFASLLAHELSHALVSRAKAIPIEGITLFIFGGMARSAREPDTPRDELMIAGVGPLASFALAGLFWAIGRSASGLGAGPAVVEVAAYLSVINLALALFNLLPGFPLDGGRVFRALAWQVTGDRARATRWAAAGGRWIGTFLMVLGAVEALAGAPLGGLWLAFIGWFLRSLARLSYQQHLLQDVLAAYVARDLMTPDPQVISVRMPLALLVDDHFLRLRFGGYPVIDDGALVGLVTLEDVKGVPRERWPRSTVADVMVPLAGCAVVPPGASLAELLDEMSVPATRGRALVVDRGRLLGIVSGSDIARWMQRVQWLESMRRGREASAPDVRGTGT